jgi:hypothetical protein
MHDTHIDVIKLLIAAQVAVVEHSNEELGVEGSAKKALIQRLTEALKLAKKFDD